MKKIILILGFMSLLSISMASNYAEFINAKVIGMGGAYTAIANDENALFYNPAGLSFIDGGKIGHVNAEISLLADDGFQKLEELTQKYENLSGDINWLAAGVPADLKNTAGLVFVGMGVSYFNSGFALGAHNTQKIKFGFDDTGENLEFNGKGILSLGLSNKVIDNLALGVTLKAVMNDAFKEHKNWAELASENATAQNEKPANYKKASNLAANIGAMYKLGDFSFGASVENFWASEVKWEDENGNPLPNSLKNQYKINPVTRLGIGYTKDQTLIAMDISKPGDADNQAFHFGIQQKIIAIPFIDWLGDITGRVGYLTGKTRLQGANTANEVSTTSFGLAARLLIAHINLNMITKKIADKEFKETSISAQIKF